MTTGLRPSIATVADAHKFHALLLSCRESIPLVPEFAEPRYVEWARGECKARRFIVVRQGSPIAGGDVPEGEHRRRGPHG